MTAFLRNTFSLLLGLYFLLAGTGFNIVNYCCDSCESKGIEYIAKHSCEEVHHHKSDCCESHSHASADSHQDIACTGCRRVHIVVISGIVTDGDVIFSRTNSEQSISSNSGIPVTFILTQSHPAYSCVVVPYKIPFQSLITDGDIAVSPCV